MTEDYYEILGVPRATLSDDDAIRMVLDPSKNRILGETLTLTTHDKLSRALFHPSYTFRKTLSHTADSVILTILIVIGRQHLPEGVVVSAKVVILVVSSAGYVIRPWSRCGPRRLFYRPVHGPVLITTT